MTDTFLVCGIEIDGKTIPIANFLRTGLLEEGATFTVMNYNITPLREGEKIEIPLKTKVEIVNISIIPEELPEVIIKPIY